MIAIDPPVRILTFALESKGPSTHALADALRAIVELDLSELQAVEPPRGFGRD